MSLARLDRSDGVATLTLARPAMHNALTPELLRDVLDALDAVRADEAVHALVLRAEGPAFSIGGDMRRFALEHGTQPGTQHGKSGTGDVLAYAHGLVGALNDVILALTDLPQPVVVAVHGLVTGGSIGLVLGADLVLLAPTVQFKAHYASAGFSPDGGWTALLPRLIGRQRATAAVLLNRTISAEDALAWGLAHRIVDGATLDTEALATARRIAAYPVGTMQHAKALLWPDRAALAAALEEERRRFLDLIDGAGARGGVARFLETYAGYPRESGAAPAP